MLKLIQKITLLFFIFFIQCSFEDYYVIVSKETHIKYGMTEVMSRRNLNEVGIYSGLTIEIPEEIKVNLKTKKLILKSGRESDFYIILYDRDHYSRECQIQDFKDSKLIMVVQGEHLIIRKYNRIDFISEEPFITNEIIWFSKDTLQMQ